MSNFQKNQGFFNFQTPFAQLPVFCQLPWENYQQFSFVPFFWYNQSLTASYPQSFVTYAFSSFIPNQNNSSTSNKASPYSFNLEKDSLQIESRSVQINFFQTQQQQIQKSDENQNMHANTRSVYATKPENMNLNSVFLEHQDQNKGLIKSQSLQVCINEDKRLIQNLRYQRKNIEANIVNKIYTFLKKSLKSGLKLIQNNKLEKEKTSIYLKVLQKLEKAGKQTIKRQFLKDLVSMNDNSPGYSKISKQLQKKGQCIQQFSLYIRIIIRNYIKKNARNSILTSKKMNPILWRDHLKKVRDLEQDLFYGQNYQQVQ